LRRDTALTLLSKFRKKDFLHKIIAGNANGFFIITLNIENYGLTLVNLRHRRQSPISTPKILLCIWWNWKSVLYYELLQPDETIAADRYQQHLTNLSDA